MHTSAPMICYTPEHSTPTKSWKLGLVTPPVPHPFGIVLSSGQSVIEASLPLHSIPLRAKGMPAEQPPYVQPSVVNVDALEKPNILQTTLEALMSQVVLELSSAQTGWPLK